MRIAYLVAAISLLLVGCQNGYTEKNSNEGINDMHSDWNEAYDEFLNDIEKDASVVCKEIDYNESKSTCINIHMDDEHCADPGSYIGYRLCDVNQDDIPELFVEIYGYEANHHVHIYTWKENRIDYCGWLDMYHGNLYYSATGKEVIHYRHRGGQCWILKMTNDGEMYEEWATNAIKEDILSLDETALNDEYTEIPFYSKDDYEGIEERDSEITVDEQENEGDSILSVTGEAAEEREFVYYDLKEKEYATIDLDSNEIEKYREEFREDIEIKCDPDRIDSIAWPDDIAPYMSYDWINDERIHVGEFYNTGLSMQLADINGDGQREMLVSAAYYPMEDETCVYTVEDASVIYLGKIHAGENKYEREGREWKEMDMGDDYFPIDIVGIYRNNSGEVRCLSEIVNGATTSYGYRQIFEIAINGRSIEEKRVVWIRCHQGQFFYGWEIEGEMEDWDKYEWKEDEQGHREIQDEFNLYMNGYYPIETGRVTSTYRIPRLAAVLDDEEQNNIRYNIRWGFAEVLGMIE